MRRVVRALLVATALVLLALWLRQTFPPDELVESACGAPAGASSEAAHDLIAITIDTLRADRLGAYGHAAARTPTVDGLAAAGVRFDQATTPMPRTTPALASLFTGLWPHHHGSREVGRPVTAGKTLATVLCERGYETVAVSASQVAGPKQRLHRGFARFLTVGAPRAGRVTERALDLVREAPPDRPLFLWVHYDDPHFKYRPPFLWEDQPRSPGCRKLMRGLRWRHSRGDLFSNRKGVSDAVLAECKALYDAEIAYNDFEIGRLLTGLGKQRDLDRAFVVLTSDHGENLGERGLYYEHGPNLHDASLRVPLVLAGPGLERGRVDAGVSQLEDVMPTLLTLLGVPDTDRPRMDGVDLSARVRAGSHAARPGPARVALAESGSALQVSLHGYLHSGRARDEHCLNDHRYALCGRRDGPAALYDHVADPDRERELGAELPKVKQRLLEARLRWPPEEARERCARTPRFKLVEYPRLEGGYEEALYDLRNDPAETRDVSAENPEVLAWLREELDAFTAGIEVEEAPELGAEEVRALQALGYVE